VVRRLDRLAVLSTGQLDAMLTLGLVPAGSTWVEDGALYDAYLAAAYPDRVAALAAITDLGTRMGFDTERLSQLRPDLILMNGTVLRRDVYVRLSEIAPVVVTRGTGRNWKGDFLLLGAALGRSGTARGIMDAYHTDADSFARRVSRPVPSVSFVASIGGRTRIMGTASFAGGIAADLGLARPTSQRFPDTSRDLSAELLDEADADWVFYAGRGAGLGPMLRSPLWGTLQAVRARRAIPVEVEPFFLNAGPTAARLVLDKIVATIPSAGPG